jgi:hypothetical protein
MWRVLLDMKVVQDDFSTCVYVNSEALSVMGWYYLYPSTYDKIYPHQYHYNHLIELILS